MGFFRQDYWSGLSCLPPGELPNPRTELGSPALQADSLPAELPGKNLKSGPTKKKSGGLVAISALRPSTNSLSTLFHFHKISSEKVVSQLKWFSEGITPRRGVSDPTGHIKMARGSTEQIPTFEPHIRGSNLVCLGPVGESVFVRLFRNLLGAILMCNKG